ncbi:MAG TPA: DUF1343 domain-containing protein [Bacteroidetes bacterium]|nr:DUF1343 domain-containing protein [Bacteroidota bacterium]
MNRLPHILASVLLAQSLIAQTPVVKTGIEVLREKGFDILHGRRVGLVTNPTGVDSKLNSTIGILHSSTVVNLVALFGPEHGVRGDQAAGDKVETCKDEETQLPVYSLYGKTRKPTQEMLKNVDVLVYDIQDIGCRSYTFISTMGLAMEAAAENSVEFVVLDRPNPLGGERVEGNIGEKQFVSFVSQFPIPYVYGLTCGELATMLNEEGMLKNGVKCRLTVVPMKGWKRTMTFEQTGLPWVPTSPHIPTSASAMYTVGTGIIGELGVISEGVGYTTPFQVLAAPWINPVRLADKLNALKLEGILFRPLTFRPFYGRWKDSTLRGVQLHITDPSQLNLMSLQFLFMQAHNELHQDKNPFLMADAARLKAFDNVIGTDEIRKRFVKRMKYEDIRDYLQKDVDAFRQKSRQYWLYR